MFACQGFFFDADHRQQIREEFIDSSVFEREGQNEKTTSGPPSTVKRISLYSLYLRKG